jgi:Spy/CpxP family protein refolding chaperone
VLRETLTQVHQVLDARQRAKLGQWLREHRSCHGHCC